LLVAHRDADTARCVVAEPEIGGGRLSRKHDGAGGQSAAQKGTAQQGRLQARHGPSVIHRPSVVIGPFRSGFHARPYDLSTCTIGMSGQRGLSTTIARKSFTLVWVAPGLKRLSTPAKNSVELLSARKTAGSRPSRWARLSVVSST